MWISVVAARWVLSAVLMSIIWSCRRKLQVPRFHLWRVHIYHFPWDTWLIVVTFSSEIARFITLLAARLTAHLVAHFIACFTALATPLIACYFSCHITCFIAGLVTCSVALSLCYLFRRSRYSSCGSLLSLISSLALSGSSYLALSMFSCLLFTPL